MKKGTLNLFNKLISAKEIKELNWFITNIKRRKNKIKKVLDIGCGRGIKTICLANEFKDIKFFGIDKDKEEIIVAKQFLKYTKIKLKFSVANIGNLSSKLSNFDCIISTRVFHFIKKKNNAFKKISGVLNLGGFLFMIEFPNKLFIPPRNILKSAKNNGLKSLNQEILENIEYKNSFKLIFQKNKA